jgi:hypothetical protein
MRRPAVLIVAIFSATLLQLSPVVALTCPPDGSPPVPGQPLPASCFEGSDGNQVDSDGTGDGNDRLDWQSILGVLHSHADNSAFGSDSQFGPGGSEENPDSWTFDFGSLGSDKYDILSGYLAQEPGSGDVFVALGFIRSSNNGTTHLAFELNQLAPGYRIAIENHSNAVIKVPTRSAGDLLITYSVDPPVIGVCRWSGNEHSGHWLDFIGNQAAGSNCPPPPPNLVQGAMNASAIPAAQNFLQGGALDAKTFAEATVNLTDALALFNPAGTCFTFNYAWLHSRSSISITSNQQDVILPSTSTVISNCVTPPTPTPTPTATPTSTPTATPEGTAFGGTGTPQGSLTDSAMASFSPTQPLAAIGFGLLLIVSLGVLAVANVRSRQT